MENQNRQTVSPATHAHNDVTTWALPEGAIARLGRGTVQNIAFSSDGRRLAVASGIGLWVYDVYTLNPIALWDTDRGVVSTVAFSPNGDLLAAGNWDGTLKVWDVQSQRCIYKNEPTERIPEAARLVFSPDGQYLAYDHRNAVSVLHLETGEHVAEFTVDAESPSRGRGRLFIAPLAFSSDGNLLASATPENAFSLWDIASGARIATLTEHTADVVALVFSPCGQFLISGDKNGGLYQSDFNESIVKGESSCCSVLPIPAKSSPQLMYFADGTLRVAAKEGPHLTVWDANSGGKLGTLRVEPGTYRIGFSATASQMAMVKSDKIQMWDIGAAAPEATVIRGHTETCGAVKFSPDGKTLAAGVWSGDIGLWDVQGLEQQATFRCEGLDMVRSIDFSPCGTKLACSSKDTTVRIWHIQKRDAPPVELVGHQAPLYAVAFSPKGNLLVSADSEGVLGFWDVQSDNTLQMFTEETDSVRSISFSPDGKSFASAHQRIPPQLWDIESGEQITELSLTLPDDVSKYKGDARGIRRFLKWLEEDIKRSVVPKALVFSPDGTLIAGGAFREIRLWDATTYETRMVICLPQGCQSAYALTFSPCGRYLASGSWWQGTKKVSIRLWNVATGENIATFWGHSTDVQDLAFSPDGVLLASGSYDGTILLWDLKPVIGS